jgi:hypothetical protein
MGILADFFVATLKDALAYSHLGGDLPPGRYELLRSGRITSIELGTLWAIMEGVEWNSANHSLTEFDQIDSSESWLSELPSPLVELLASLDDPEIEQLAAEWCETDEMVGPMPEAMFDFIGELRHLARISQSTGNGLYLWNAL